MADKLTRQIAPDVAEYRTSTVSRRGGVGVLNEEVAAYARGMQALCEFNLSPLAEDVRAQLAQLAQDERLRRRMSVRLGHLSNNIFALLKSNASAQAYHTVSTLPPLMAGACPASIPPQDDVSALCSPWASSVTGKQETNQMLILYLRPAGARLDLPAGP